MVWGKAGSTTLTSTSDTIDCTTTTSSKFNMFIAHEIGSGNINSRFRINSDSSTSVYADRTSINFGSDTERSPNSDGWITAEVNLANNSDDKFIVGYYCDISGEEKLFMGCNCDRHDADNTAVERVDFAAKYVPSPDASITTFGAYNGNSGDYASGSNVSVLGSEITPAAAITFPTNVQVGSRAEITDSIKMYNYSDVSTSELKAYYKFDESSGNIINQATSVGSSDSLGTDADMTISGATYSQTGKLGSALSFDGSNDFGTLGSSLSQWNLFHGTGDWTLNYWINFGAFTSEAKIFSNLDSTETRGINVRVGGSDPDGTIGLSIKSDNGFMVNTGSISFNQTLSTGTWYMITLTCDHSLSSANYQVSVNGTGQGTANRSVLGSGNNAEHSTKIMRRGGSSDGFVNADIDEMSIWNRLLTADEITSLYNSNSGRAISSGIFTEWQEIGA